VKAFSKILTPVLSLFVLLSQAQEPKTASTNDSSFILVRTYHADIADALIDNLDNLYIISSTGQIKKWNSSGDSIGLYNQVKNFGKLYAVDVSNPLKLLLFYKDFSTIVLLDRYLATLTTINLRRYSILQPAAIGLSYDNNIWVFDAYDNKLKKINEQGIKLLETPDFRTIFDESFVPQKIISDNGLLYLADTLHGVFVFDNYGSFKKKIPLLHWQNIAVKNNYIISTANDAIVTYNTATLLQSQKKLPFFKPYFRSFTGANRMASFSADTLHIYQYRF
jgi:hypothetical protein